MTALFRVRYLRGGGTDASGVSRTGEGEEESEEQRKVRRGYERMAKLDRLLCALLSLAPAGIPAGTHWLLGSPPPVLSLVSLVIAQGGKDEAGKGACAAAAARALVTGGRRGRSRGRRRGAMGGTALRQAKAVGRFAHRVAGRLDGGHSG